MVAPSRKRALDNYAAKRTAAGDKQVLVWLSAAARDGLARLAKVHGSKKAALEALLIDEPRASWSPDRVADEAFLREPAWSGPIASASTPVVINRGGGPRAALTGEAIPPRLALQKGGKR